MLMLVKRNLRAQIEEEEGKILRKSSIELEQVECVQEEDDMMLLKGKLSTLQIRIVKVRFLVGRIVGSFRYMRTLPGGFFCIWLKNSFRYWKAIFLTNHGPFKIKRLELEKSTGGYICGAIFQTAVHLLFEYSLVEAFRSEEDVGLLVMLGTSTVVKNNESFRRFEL